MTTISLRPITPDNWRECIRLKPAEHQREFVASNLFSLAQSAVRRDWVPLAIYTDEQMVGFALYGLDPHEQTYWIYRLMIDEQHQQHGFGRAALTELIGRMRAIPDCAQVTLSYEPQNAVAARLYASAGFAETGEVIEGEVVARLALTRAAPAGAVRPATRADLPAMVELSERKRAEYAVQQPVYWRKAPDSRERQLPFFEAQLAKAEAVLLVHETDGQVDGFLIGMVGNAPPVYAPGGPVLVVDDFCVKGADAWLTAGKALLAEARAQARTRGAVLSVVMCGDHDAAKRSILAAMAHTPASSWWTASIDAE